MKELFSQEISHFFHPAAKLLIVVIPCKISELYTSEIIMLIKWPYMATWYAKGFESQSHNVWGKELHTLCIGI